MLHQVVMKGPTAEMRWSYLVAATLRDWVITAQPARLTVTATVIAQDTFAVSQQPLTFVVQRATGQWRWPIHSLQMVGETVTATLGPQE